MKFRGFILANAAINNDRVTLLYLMSIGVTLDNAIESDINIFYHYKITDVLLKYGYVIKQPHKFGSIIFQAAYLKNIQLCRRLLQFGVEADIDNAIPPTHDNNEDIFRYESVVFLINNIYSTIKNKKISINIIDYLYILHYIKK